MEVPAGWSKRLSEEADLEASEAELGGVESFQADSCRGRLFLIQGFLRKAEECLRRATETLERTRATIAYAQALVHHAYCRELSILRGEESVSDEEPTPWQDHAGLPTESAMIAHRSLDAAQALVDGRAGRALGIYEELTREAPVRAPGARESRVVWEMGSAVACMAVDRDARALRHLEDAGLHVAACLPLLPQARASARLATIYDLMGRDRCAREWEEFLSRLPCPEETKRGVRRRAARLLVLHQTTGRLIFA